MNLKNSPKLIPKKSSKREKKLKKHPRNTNSGYHRPRTWARASSPSPCSLHRHMDAQFVGIMQCIGCLPSAFTPNAPQWVYTYVGRTPSWCWAHPPHSPHGHTPYSPRGHGLSHRVQCVWVQVALSNPLSPLMGSRTLHEPNTR